MEIVLFSVAVFVLAMLGLGAGVLAGRSLEGRHCGAGSLDAACPDCACGRQGREARR